MEYKKKKNGADQSRRNVMIGIMLLVCILMIYGAIIVWHQLSYGESDYWSPTATSIVATNNAVATLIEQTDVAATERFMMTSTAKMMNR